MSNSTRKEIALRTTGRSALFVTVIGLFALPACQVFGR